MKERIILNTTGNWWLITIKGIILTLLGALIIFNPVGGLLGVIIYIGLALLFSGIVITAFSLRTRKENRNWGWHLNEGILDLLLGLFFLFYPGMTADLLPVILAFYSIFFGVYWIIQTVFIAINGCRFWAIALINGLAGLAIGFLVLTYPVISILTIVGLIGLAFMIYGLFLTMLSFQIRKMKLFIHSFV